MKKIIHIGIRAALVSAVVLAAVLGGAGSRPAAADGPDPFDLRDNPIYLLASYYNALALHDYARAYAYWNGHEPSGATLAQFAQGFANVQDVQALARLPITVEGAAGTLHAEIPVVVLTTLTGGTSQIFAGCFHVTKLNVPVGDATEPDPNWSLNSATLEPATSVDFVQAVSACSYAESFPTAGQSDDRLTPPDLISSYYDAIAAHDYLRAYNYWQGGPPNQTYAQFVQGFSGTADVGVVLGLSFSLGGAAGSTYASTPLLITATNNGLSQLFVGCLVTRQSNVPVGDATTPDPNWWLYSAHTYAVTTLEQGVQLVWSVCDGY